MINFRKELVMEMVAAKTKYETLIRLLEEYDRCNPHERQYLESTEEIKPASEAAKFLSGLGASKGGRVRANLLTQERRHEIAVKAAACRWSKR